MLQRYYLRNNPEIVPYSNARYTVTLNGTVEDVQTNQQVMPDIKGRLTLVLAGIARSVLPEWAVAVTFKPVYNGATFLSDLVDKWDVLTVKETTGVHPGNLVWCPPPGGQECPDLPGFFVIPGFTRYVINRQGSVIRRRNGPYASVRRMKLDLWLKEKAVGRKEANRYRGYDVRADDDHYTCLGTHRLLGLAFLAYGPQVDSLTVNHRDGNKSNNALEANLEWATFKENNDHARQAGLWNNYRGIEVKDHWTGEITNYRSVTEVADRLQQNSGTIYCYATDLKHRAFRFRWTFRLSGDTEPHPSFEVQCLQKEKAIAEKRKQALGCWAFEIRNRTYLMNIGPAALAKQLGWTKDQVRTALDSEVKLPVLGYAFGYSDDHRMIRDYPLDEIEVFSKHRGIRDAYRVYEANGNSTVIIGNTALAQFLGVYLQKLDRTIARPTGRLVWQFNDRRIVRLPP